MGFYKDNTVEIKFGGFTHRVSQETKDSLESQGKLDGQDNSDLKTEKVVEKAKKSKK